MMSDSKLQSYGATNISHGAHCHPHNQDLDNVALLETEDGEDSVTRSTISVATHHPQESRLRRWALGLSLWINVAITVAKLVAYIQTLSLSVLAALVDSLLDIVSQLVLNYTEKHSSLQRSSALYPAGASRLEPVGVLTCAALMGMASFEVIKESIERLASKRNFASFDEPPSLASFWNLLVIIFIKLGLLWICQKAAEEKRTANDETTEGGKTARQTMWSIDPTLEALAQDHWNDALSNGVAAAAVLFTLKDPNLWWVDPVGAITISMYIIHSWFATGKEQVEQLTGKAAPKDFIAELYEIANNFDDRIIVVDVCRAYHFGPKFLVEIEVVLPKETLLFESHDLGMDLQYEIEGREEVERCFVHIDYETRPYDEHVVSKVPGLREKYKQKRLSSCHSV
mmetsp:Transcript_8001/g.11567  ORF Transcript_8001/g.11567 Transcript_8001/m.11567 type:complete len:399 (-) Transcript_8001:2041-3237(-)